jgi:hypothetical protein
MRGANHFLGVNIYPYHPNSAMETGENGKGDV